MTRPAPAAPAEPAAPDRSPASAPRRARLPDLAAALGAAALVAAAVLVGRHIQATAHTLFVGWPPLLGRWHPHLGPGTPAALLVAVAVIAYGPPLAARLPWRALPFAAWGACAAWTWSLALVDGWRRGIAGRLTTRYEYLQVIDRFRDIPATLRDFDHHILLHSPGHWPPHVAGHPPAATLTFVLLDRIGLGGGGWAGVWCITVGTTACAAVLLTVRALAGEALARRAAPFLVLAPAAVWTGTSADAYFTAVAAWTVALAALAVTGQDRRPPARTRLLAAGSGLLMGLTCYLSYGLTLMAVPVAAAVLLGTGRRLRLLPFAAAGLTVVPLTFTLLGFDWWEAYRLLVRRYYEGAGGIRPYGYWVWANLACTVLITGLATAAGLRRAAGELLVPRRDRPAARLALLVAAVLLALLVADLSGMSKAETERIWLPFAAWLTASGAFLDRPRAWLAAQAALALLLNHLLWTGW